MQKGEITGKDETPTQQRTQSCVWNFYRDKQSRKERSRRKADVPHSNKCKAEIEHFNETKSVERRDHVGGYISHTAIRVSSEHEASSLLSRENLTHCTPLE